MARICFFCGNISWSGGTERVSTAIANQLAVDGHEIFFISLYGNANPHFKLHGSILSKSLYASKKPFKLIAPMVAYRLRKFVDKNNIEVLVDVDSILSIYSIPATLFKKVKHVSWEHFNFVSDFGMPSRRVARLLAAKLSDVVITLTKQDKLYWENGVKCNAKIIAIPNPTPFLCDRSHDVERENIVLSVGRLAEQKGFDLLLKAWEKVESDTRSDNWCLMIVGDGEDREKLYSLRDRLNLKRVVFIPFNRDIEHFYSRASIYAMSSRFEGFPMVLLEAGSFGLPVVAFDCDTGPKELIIDGVTGFLAPMGDVSKFVEALLMLISEQKMRVDMSINAKKVLDDYRVSVIIKHWHRLIDDLVS